MPVAQHLATVLCLRLACIWILKGRSDVGFVVLLATKCSSWGPMNRGTSGRSACCSVGNLQLRSVVEGNQLCERIGSTCETCFEHVLTNLARHSPPKRSPIEKKHFIWVPWRSCLLCLLTTSKGGVWCLEQPGLSVMEFYPAFRYMLNCHIVAGGNLNKATRLNEYI